jgi:hypothetical protein
MNTGELITSERNSAVGGIATVNQAIALAAAVLDKRIATARNWPRSVSKFKQEAIALLQEDIETARSAEYSKPSRQWESDRAICAIG